jgi:pyrroloquinoline-quinone synthase
MTRAEDTVAACSAHVERFHLEGHPFYLAWREGTLPLEKLQTYAHAYGRFIGALPALWRAAGDEQHGKYEEEHWDMWQGFTRAVDGRVQSAPETRVPQADALVAMTGAFTDGPEALGALYAFELQQPKTAGTKLEGLRAHYPLGEEAEAYFIEHMNDEREQEVLAERIAALDEAGRDRAQAACAMTSAALWLALDGVLAA